MYWLIFWEVWFWDAGFSKFPWINFQASCSHCQGWSHVFLSLWRSSGSSKIFAHMIFVRGFFSFFSLVVFYMFVSDFTDNLISSRLNSASLPLANWPAVARMHQRQLFFVIRSKKCLKKVLKCHCETHGTFAASLENYSDIELRYLYPEC